GTYGGSLRTVPASELGRQVVSGMLKSSQFSAADFDLVVCGNVFAGGDVHNPARYISVFNKMNDDTATYTVNRLCGSGLQAIINAIIELETGNATVACAVGTENMSRYPHMMLDARFGTKYGNIKVIDGTGEVLSDPIEKYPAGLLGENCAREYQIPREEQDQFALESQQKTATAWQNGYFDSQIIPIETPKGMFAKDEHPRETSLEKLATLPPAFQKGGSVTAGNASGVNDGAAAVFLTTADVVKEKNLKPMARIVSYAQAGMNHHLMGYAPTLSTQKALTKAGKTIHDMDLIEINEAFAAQVLAVEKGLQWDRSKVNVNGGAIALGHPLGMSGVRIVVMLAHELKRRNLKFGVATICIGGGMGLSLIIENVYS
ncbi:MAG: thiolase family protein, partial [Bacteroidia bacterium]|nr:thiolase family protein [Bacteroidia bacterium]